MIRLCGARNRKGGLCQRVACKNGKCHNHGGLSTGAKTQEGKMRQKMASWVHGKRSREAIEENRMIRQFMKGGYEFLGAI
jgi:hypothetical protein